MPTFFVEVRTRDRGDRKDRIHRFYVTDVFDVAEARRVAREAEGHVYTSTATRTFMGDHCEVCEPGPQVINVGVRYADRTEAR